MIERIYLINKTSHKIVLTFCTYNRCVGEANNKLFADGNSTDSVIWDFACVEIRTAMDPMGYDIAYLYNLSDTTSISKDFYDLSKSTWIEGGESALASTQVTRRDFIVTDSVLQLMSKDTSMLSKFPEYYKK